MCFYYGVLVLYVLLVMILCVRIYFNGVLVPSCACCCVLCCAVCLLLCLSLLSSLAIYQWCVYAVITTRRPASLSLIISLSLSLSCQSCCWFQWCVPAATILISLSEILFNGRCVSVDVLIGECGRRSTTYCILVP